MKLLLDEDSQGRSLVQLLRAAGHEVLTVGEASLSAHTDAEVLIYAGRERRYLLTANVRGFLALHAANPDHAGILCDHQSEDPGKNMTDSGILRAITHLQVAGWDLSGMMISLNDWISGPPEP